MLGSGYGQIFAHGLKVYPGNATLAQQLLAAVNHPASGGYIDVSEAKYVHIVCQLGVMHASDAVTFQPKCSDAVDGTLDDIVDRDDTTWGLHTAAVTDDEEFITWTFEVDNLPEDHHFVAVDIGGTTSNGSYGVINFYLDDADLPVTQTTAVLPTASQYWLGGGNAETDLS